MGSQQKVIAAIEIGSSKIKGAVGTIDEFGTLTVQAVETVAVTDTVRYGWIRNVSAVSAVLNNIIRQLENRMAPRKIESIYVGIGGRSLRADERNVERQLAQEVEIKAPLLENLSNEARQIPDYTDRDVVGVIPCEYRVDGTVTSQPVGMMGRNIRGNFRIVTCKQQQRRNLEMVVLQKLNLRINDFIVRPLAQGNLLLTREEISLGCMLVDFGAETTTVSIYKNGALRYLSTIPLGSRLITRDIMSLNFMEEQAEEIKRASGSSMGQPTAIGGTQSVNMTEINNYISARVKEIIANIKAQLQFAGLSSADLPAGIVIVGNGAKLNGFNSRLSAETKMQVRAGTPGAVVRISDGSINPTEMVDIISVLYSATLSNPMECTVMPMPEVVVEPEPQPQPVYQKPQPEPAHQTAAPQPRTVPEPEPTVEPQPEMPSYQNTGEKSRGKRSRWDKFREKLNIFLQEDEGDFNEDLRDD